MVEAKTFDTFVRVDGKINYSSNDETIFKMPYDLVSWFLLAVKEAFEEVYLTHGSKQSWSFSEHRMIAKKDGIYFFVKMNPFDLNINIAQQADQFGPVFIRILKDQELWMD